jgi:hypothetical protein
MAPTTFDKTSFDTQYVIKFKMNVVDVTEIREGHNVFQLY